MSHAEAFTDMARRIDEKNPHEFGGALVLVAPDGKRVEFLLTDPSSPGNLIAFWSWAKTRIEDAMNEMVTANAGMSGGFPNRMR